MTGNDAAVENNGFFQNGHLKHQPPSEISGAPENKGRSLCSQRLLLAFVGLFGGVMLESNRAFLSVAIVCMVNNTDLNTINTTKTTSPVSEHAEFFWSKSEQAGILSAYFYGYMVTQIPAGILASKYGGKHVVFIGMLIGSITTLLLPIGARTSIYLVYVLRVILGASQGVYFPSVHGMWGQWAPPLERTKLLAICYSGTKIGTIAAFAFSGFLCEYGFDNGWGSMFYISGGLCVLWCGVWYITVSSTPSQHPRISREERTYILDSIGGSHKVSPTPWLLMMTSAATWACLIGHVCSEWATQTLRTHAPTFMNEVFNFNITEKSVVGNTVRMRWIIVRNEGGMSMASDDTTNGLLSSIPYMSQTVSSLIAGQLADYLRSRKYLSTTATRRIFQSVGFIGTGASLVCTGYVDVDNRYVAVFLLACAMWFIGFGAAGFMVNVVDFAPRHSGVLFGVANSIMALVAGVGGPTVAGALTPNKTQEEWRNVFYVCGGFCILGTVVFGTQARGELQPWAVDQVEVIVGESKDVPTVSSSALQLNSGRLEEKTTRISTHL